MLIIPSENIIPMLVGQVIGSTTLDSFRFVIKAGHEEKVKRDEFVIVKEAVTGDDILGVIKDIVITNDLLPDEFARDLRLSDIMLTEGEYPVPLVKVLGIKRGKNLELPRHGIQPGSEVNLAPDELLDEILQVGGGREAFLGTLSTREDVRVCVDINEMVSRHLAVLAMTGSGKSYTVGVVIEELMQKNGSVVVFDLHGEFKNVQDEGFKTRLYDVEGEDRIKVDVSTLSTGELASIMGDITPTQRDLFDELMSVIRRHYDRFDLSQVSGLLDSIYDAKKSEKDDDVVMPKRVEDLAKKVNVATVGGLLRRVRRLERMGVFKADGKSFDELVRPGQLSIINLSDADERICDVIVASVARGIFDGRKKYLKSQEEGIRYPTFLIVEEAHNFAPRSLEGDYSPPRKVLRKIAREGRKFGVGLCIVSQRPNKLDADVLSQCNTQVIMKIVNPSDQEYIRQSVESVTEDIVRDLPSLCRGEAIITGSAINLAAPVRIRKRKTHVGGSDIDIVSEWAKSK